MSTHLLAAMNEAEWLATTDPRRMLQLLQGQGSDRKLRLFLVASARLVWDEVPEGEMRDAVHAAEAYADGLIGIERLDEFRGRFYQHFMHGGSSEVYSWVHSNPRNALVFTLARMTTYNQAMARTLERNSNWIEGIHPVHPLLPPLLRDLFGNPFNPPTFEPTWVTSTVRGLAEGIYDGRAFDRMPILADALEDAGCDNPDILAHCRGDGPHVRGCWVVDLVLGKE